MVIDLILFSTLRLESVQECKANLKIYGTIVKSIGIIRSRVLYRKQ